MARYASLLSDVEDPINDLSDDAALDVATAVAQTGCVGSFCVTGDKARRLVRLGRHDVLDQLRRHCLGLHTNRHSLHPTTMEMLEGLNWQDGLDKVLESERKGTEAFQTAFGRLPAFWGGAGNTWGPQVCEALVQLGFPTLVYSHLEGPGQTPVMYADCLCLPSAFHLSEDRLASTDFGQSDVDRLAGEVARHPSPWVEVFIGHPTRYRHLDFWDRHTYSGETEAPPYEPPLRSASDYHRALDNLKTTLSILTEVVEVIPVSEVSQLRWQWRRPSLTEAEEVIQRAQTRVQGATSWPVHKKELDVSAILECLVQEADTIQLAT